VVGVRRILGAFAQGCFWTGLVLAIAGSVSANPIILPPNHKVQSIVSWLFLANLPVDMILFASAFLLVIWTSKSPMWSPQRSRNMLIAEVAVGGVAIAAPGALIDFYALFTEHILRDSYTIYVPEVTLENLALAGGGIFATVYAVSICVVRLRLMHSLIPAALLTAVNLFAWITLDSLTWDGDTLLGLAGLFLFVPPLMFGIAYAQEKKVVGP